MESALNVQLKYLGNAHRKVHLTYFTSTFEVRKITTCDVCSTCIKKVFKSAFYVGQNCIQGHIACIRQKITVRNCIIKSVFHFLVWGNCFLFFGRLDCRFSTRVFIVKRGKKTSDYLTRNNLDLSTPPFYSLKRRKKAGFRTQSHSTDNYHTWTYTPWQSRWNVRWMCIECTFIVHSMHISSTS